ncbi:hypothetical protein [Corallococcus sp. Z5C101001]|uniref:hypothetical protein n=1 Tax=Corallococcus sp. Z5C101001 TaxID=2596829 RepID=UPI00163D4F29|nr:hypothetical protein [Corallococcus sp. Z5C101001]
MIERISRDMHANVTRDHRRKKMSALMVEVAARLDARDAQQTASLLLRVGPARRAA